LTVLKSSIPYVSGVTNFKAARGGTDSETLESAKLRAPEVLKARTRAVTAEDFEYFACEASLEVARAKCLVPKSVDEKGKVSPGTVQLLIVPAIDISSGQILKDQLALPERLRSQVADYLDEHRLLTTKLVVTAPDYCWVTVDAKVSAKARTDPKRLGSAIEKKLFQFINPISGGPEGTGWPFGRDLLASDLLSLLQGIPGVDFVEQVNLFLIDIETGKLGEATTRVSLAPDQLLCYYQHQVMTG